MKTQTGRLVMAMAMLWIAFGAGVRAEAGGIALSTPTGLAPGDTFRFVFVTDGTTTATSSNIADYNAFVNAQAGGATYNGAVVTWDAIGSTSTVNAIDNVGQTLTPVYLADGTLVTTSTTSSGLWSGFLLAPINEDLSGTGIAKFVWTGTDILNGIAFEPLGGQFYVTYGNSSLSTSEWVTEAFSPLSTEYLLYGISQVLTVPGGAAVPEPSSLVMAATAIFGVSALGWYCKRRDQRQRPVGTTCTTE